MKYANTLIFLSALMLFGAVKSEDLVLGTVAGVPLVYTENVDLSGAWLYTRTKNVFYNSGNNQIIRGISAIDLDKSKAKATITAGGVGFTFVNLRLRSEKGERLKYLVQIFA